MAKPRAQKSPGGEAGAPPRKTTGKGQTKPTARAVGRWLRPVKPPLKIGRTKASAANKGLVITTRSRGERVALSVWL